MSDFRKKVLVGNTVLYPEIIKQFLMKSHYWLFYDPPKEKMTLNANHGQGAEILFEIRNVSYESACKLAEGLGLKSDSHNELSCIWSKWNPVLHLDHDKSLAADMLHMELLKLSIPHVVHSNKEKLALTKGGHMYQYPSWQTGQMLDIIQQTADQYKEQLATKP